MLEFEFFLFELLLLFIARYFTGVRSCNGSSFFFLSCF